MGGKLALCVTIFLQGYFNLLCTVMVIANFDSGPGEGKLELTMMVIVH